MADVNHSVLIVFLAEGRSPVALGDKDRLFVQQSCEYRVWVMSTMPSAACHLQYIDVLLPSRIYVGTFLQE